MHHDGLEKNFYLDTKRKKLFDLGTHVVRLVDEIVPTKHFSW
jgi:hypothetical protein